MMRPAAQANGYLSGTRRAPPGVNMLGKIPWPAFCLEHFEQMYYLERRTDSQEFAPNSLPFGRSGEKIRVYN
jgi:hypothetical protein